MNTSIKWVTYVVFCIAMVFCSNSCKDDPIYTGDCFIPEASVNQVINMNLPEYYRMQTMGEFMYLEGGNRGIFLVHNYDDMFYALERTCPYQSDLSCAKIFVDSATLQLRCGEETDTGFVHCCKSLYLFNGLVTQGPSQCNLKPYRVNVQSSTLYINN